MYRFTTPKHTFSFSESIDLASLSEILITYMQDNKIILEKRKTDLTIENNTVYFRLTQQESSLFRPNLPASVQVRILYPSGDSFASKIINIAITDVLHKGTLGGSN